MRDFKADATATEEVRIALAETLSEHLLAPGFINEIVESLDSDTAREFFQAALPELASIRHGHLAEMLAHENKSYFDESTMPIKKLRYTVGSGSLHGTDVVALTLSKHGDVTHIHYVESKFREGTFLNMAIDAHRQLSQEMDRTFPVILPFILQRLYETSDPLFPVFKSMLGKKRAGEVEENFEISLCVDAENWDERIVDRLTAHAGPKLSPLVVTVIQMPQAKAIIADVFSRIPHLHVVEEED